MTGFRIVTRKDGDRLRLWSRNGRDWSVEFKAIAAALASLPAASIVLDGEAVTHCPKGLPDFHGVPRRRGGVPVRLRRALDRWGGSETRALGRSAGTPRRAAAKGAP